MNELFYYLKQDYLQLFTIMHYELSLTLKSRHVSAHTLRHPQGLPSKPLLLLSWQTLLCSSHFLILVLFCPCLSLVSVVLLSLCPLCLLALRLQLLSLLVFVECIYIWLKIHGIHGFKVFQYSWFRHTKLPCAAANSKPSFDLEFAKKTNKYSC